MISIVSYNVNGIRAAEKKGLSDWIIKEQPDVLWLQETKAQAGQINLEKLEAAGY
ncbi:MAG: endonuclease/exonuclease/phosphatase family protein, partial [Bacteroidota bacterium]